MYNRNLRKPSPLKNVFKFASRKNRSTIMCESSLEFDACFHLEYSEKVVSFASQPTGIEYFDNANKKRRYTPDFAVSYQDGTSNFIEVKPVKKLLSPDFQNEFSQKINAYSEIGQTLILVTENQIRSEPTLSNYKILHRYASFQCSYDLQIAVSAELSKSQPLNILQLASHLDSTTKSLLPICAMMLARKELETDFSAAKFLELPLMSLGAKSNVS